jgi:hypothetical protein
VPAHFKKNSPVSGGCAKLDAGAPGGENGCWLVAGLGVSQNFIPLFKNQPQVFFHQRLGRF